MPKRSKQVKKSPQPKPVNSGTVDYEQFLINKISKCQRVVEGLKSNPVWEEIKSDFEISAKSLDMTWAYEDPTSPKFKQLQATKMAVQSFMNLLPSYEHDLQLAQKELMVFRNPKTIVKKDYDDEGIPSKTFSTTEATTLKANAYHGDSNG